MWEDNGELYRSNNPLMPRHPFVESNMNQLDPTAEGRVDSKMGTIDTDPEFIKYLEALTNPEPLRGEEQQAEEAEFEKNAAPQITPLIEHIRNQKANKEKEAAQAKSAKGRQEAKTAKGKGPEDPKKAKDKGKEKAKADKQEAPKEPVKILTKKDAIDEAATAAQVAKDLLKRTSVSAELGSASATSELPKNRRAGIAAAAKLLQRDLGLSPGTAHRRARQDAAKTDVTSKATASQESGAVTSGHVAASKGSGSSDTQRPSATTRAAAAPDAGQPASPAAPKPPSKSRRGAKHADKGKAADTAPPPPVSLKKKPAGPAAQSTAAPSAAGQPSNPPASSKAAATEQPKNGEKPRAASNASQKKPTTVTPGATRGFVKHANSSQGVTEALLKETLGQFGTITFVEIDKRKGFAYVDFADHEGLLKAVAESPVAVAQANVMVLERRDKKPPQAAAGTPVTNSSGNSHAAGPSEKAAGSSRRRRGKGSDKGNGSAPQAGQAATASSSATKGTS